MRRSTPYRSPGIVLQPTPQCTQTDGAVRRSHLRVKCSFSVLSVKTPVGQTSTRLPLNSLSSVPSSCRPKKTRVAQAEGVEIAAACVVPIEAHAPVALDAPVHLVVDKRAEVLVAEGPLGDAVAPIGVAGHHRHVLQVALAALVADRAIVRVVAPSATR